MRRLASLLLLAVGSCRSGRLYSHDVADLFAREYEGVVFHVPSKEDLLPRARGGPMAKTVRLAQAYLEGRRREDSRSRYVRSLLACAHILRGEYDLARAAMGDLKAPMGTILSSENAVVEAAVHALDGCRAVEARLALEDFLEGRLSARAFLERHGGYAGIEAPSEDPGARERFLEKRAGELERRCFSDPPGDPHGLERSARARGELRRILAEQIYNEAAALLGAIPPDAGAPSECLAALTASLFVVHGYVAPDLLPFALSDEQKRWYRELALSAYARARRAARRHLRGDRYRLLRDRLAAAELMTAGWIATR